MRGIILAVLGTSVITGCAQNFYGYGGTKGATTQDAGKTIDSSSQALCDVERVRARADILKHLDIEKFREILVKVSRALTPEEITDLKQIAEAPRTEGTAHASEFERRRQDLIGEIYSGAMARAGLKTGASESIAVATGAEALSYTVGIDSLSFGNDPYVSVVQGKIGKEQEGQINDVLLGASPDQNRYYVSLRRFVRMETEADGTQVPVYNTLSLLDQVEEALPRYCLQATTALNPEEFNTVGGMGAGQAVTPILPGTILPPSVLTPPTPQNPAAAMAPVVSPAPAVPTVPVAVPPAHSGGAT